MANYYIDSVAGSDSNAGTSSAAPWATMTQAWIANVWAAGNTFYLKRGSTFTDTCAPRGSGTIASPILVTSYGTATDAKPICSNATGQGFDLVTYGGITLDGLDIRGNDQYGIGFSLYTGTAPLIVRNCRITAPYNGIYARAGATGAGSLAGVIIEDNEIYDCGEHGILIDGGLDGVIVRRNTVTGCGHSVGAHGISINCQRYTTNLSWSLTGGNVYQATITGATHTPSYPTTTSIDDVYITFASTRWVLMEDTTTAPAALAAGKYRYTGGVLYVNCGGNDPAAASAFFMTYGGQRDWIISDNTVTGQLRFGGAEGASIQIDDRASHGTITRNYCESTTVAGAIICNGSSNVTITANVVDVGGASGIAVSGYGNSCDISNNTIMTAGGSGHAIETWGSDAGGTRTIRNNIITGASLYAISDYFGAGATYTISNNCIFGPLALTVSGANLTDANFVDTLVINPRIRTSDYMPQEAALWSAGLVLGGTDFDGTSFASPPTIGAVQYLVTLVHHVRRQLREAVAAAITGLTTTGSDVFQSRVYPVQESELPALLVYVTEEEVVLSELSDPAVYQRDFTITVTGQAKAAADLDDTLDFIGMEVEIALASGVSVAGVSIDLDLTGTTISMSSDAEKPVGEIEMRYRATLYTAENTPNAVMDG